LRVGPFDVRRLVARGGMSVVFAAVHRTQRIPVALKVLGVDDDPEGRLRSAFDLEVRISAGLSHPAIVSVHDHGYLPDDPQMVWDGEVLAGRPYCVLDWMSGGTLAPLVGRLPWRDVLRASEAVLGALGHAHARGVIHRDLKPDNVLRAHPQGGERLADFGVALRIDARAVLGHHEGATGTPDYMAPEQVEGRWRDTGPWSDLYGFGCMLWELVTGRAPFERESTEATLQAHLEAAPPDFRPMVQVPVGLEAVLRGLLQKSPRDRPTSAFEVSRRLRTLSAEALEGVAGASDHTPLELRRVVLTELERPMVAEVRAPAHDEPLAALPGSGLSLLRYRDDRLVGRAGLQSDLRARLERVARNRAAEVLVLSGPEGVGRSAVARWLAHEAEHSGRALALYGASLRSGAAAPPGAGLRAAVRARLRLHGLAAVEVSERLSAVGWPCPRPLDAWLAEGGDERIIGGPDALRRALESLTAEPGAPAWCVVLDDAELDTGSLEFATRIADAQFSSPRPILVVIVVRDEATGSAHGTPSESWRRVRDLLTRPCAERVVVDALPVSARVAAVRTWAGVSDELNAALSDAAGPSLALARRWLEGLEAAGDTVSDEHGDRCAPGVQLGLQHLEADRVAVERERLLALFARRGADELAGIARLLAAASVRSPVDEAEWRLTCAELSGVSLGRLKAAVLDAGLMRPGSTRTGAPVLHLLAPLAPRVLATEAQDLWLSAHAACARVCGRHLDAASAERLGRHLAAAARAEDALEPLATATAERLARGEPLFAAGVLAVRDRVLAEARLGPTDWRAAEGAMLRARVLHAQGRALEADAWAARAESQALRASGRRTHAAARVERAGIALTLGEVNRADQLLAALPSEVGALGDARLGAELERVSARRALLDGRWHVAAARLREAVSTFERFGALADAARCALEAAEALRWGGRGAESASLMELARHHYEALSGEAGAAELAYVAGLACWDRGDSTRASECLREASRRADSTGALTGLFARIGLDLLTLEDTRSEPDEAVAAVEPRLQQRLHACLRGGLRGPAATARLGLWLCAAAATAADADLEDRAADEAIQALASASTLDPLDAELLMRIASWSLSRREFKRAVMPIREALRRWQALDRDADAARAAALLREALAST